MNIEKEYEVYLRMRFRREYVYVGLAALVLIQLGLELAIYITSWTVHPNAQAAALVFGTWWVIERYHREGQPPKPPGQRSWKA